MRVNQNPRVTTGGQSHYFIGMEDPSTVPGSCVLLGNGRRFWPVPAMAEYGEKMMESEQEVGDENVFFRATTPAAASWVDSKGGQCWTMADEGRRCELVVDGQVKKDLLYPVGHIAAVGSPMDLERFLRQFPGALEVPCAAAWRCQWQVRALEVLEADDPSDRILRVMLVVRNPPKSGAMRAMVEKELCDLVDTTIDVRDTEMLNLLLAASRAAEAEGTWFLPDEKGFPPRRMFSKRRCLSAFVRAGSFDEIDGIFFMRMADAVGYDTVEAAEMCAEKALGSANHECYRFMLGVMGAERARALQVKDAVIMAVICNARRRLDTESWCRELDDLLSRERGRVVSLGLRQLGREDREFLAKRIQ